MAILHSTKDGSPIKTKLAAEYPFLTRRQRRELMRKSHKMAAKLQQHTSLGKEQP